MKFDQRSFVGNNSIWPTPMTYFDDSSGILMVTSPWGSGATVETFHQGIVDFFASARTDTEVTSPFPRLPYLSQTANNLRVALLLGIENFYRVNNKNEFNVGLQAFIAARDGNELNWISCGNPDVLWGSKKNGLYPLKANIDLSAQVSESHKLSPLPQEMIGLSPTYDFKVNSLRFSEDDKLVLISRQGQYVKDLPVRPSGWTLDKISNQLSKNSDYPFWLGILEL